MLGVPAVAIEFEPGPPIEEGVNDWYGTAWVDPEMGQLLRVIALTPKDHETMNQWEEHSGAGNVDEVEAEFSIITTWFSKEENGLRFPGRVVLEQSRYRARRGTEADGPLGRRLTYMDGHLVEREKSGRSLRRWVLLRVEQTYRDYQFFSVRAADEIQRFVRGTSPGPASGP